MASYRWLQNGVGPSGHYFQAGEIITTDDAWVPPGAVEPIDSAAIAAFWRAGPQPCPLVRTQWSTQFVAAPAIYWKRSGTMWVLTGAGAALGPKAESAAMSLP
jgi:hypothetical protein